MASANLFDRLEASITDAARTAIATPDGGRLSYGDLVALTGRLARHLVERGVKPGDRVAAQVDKTVPALALYLATLRAGAVFLPLNSAYTPAEVDYFLTDAEPALVVCDPAGAANLAPIAARIGARIDMLDATGRGDLIDGAMTRDPDFPTLARAGDDLAAILYTSGTTGRAKGAMLTHDNLVSNALTLIDVWRFSPADILIHALPIHHTHGLFVASNVALFSGASMIFLPRFDAGEIIALMSRATVLMDAAVHLRLRAAARRDASGLARSHRPRHSRTLRADRNRHEHVESP
jgi:malonyl-CoA/methylmalonyl-CoA synthetase